MEESKKVIEQIKRSGHFDKYRQEVLRKLSDTKQMRDCVASCKKIVEEVIEDAPPDADIRKLRGILKGRLEQSKRLTRELYTASDELLDELTQSTEFNEMVDRLCAETIGFSPSDAPTSADNQLDIGARSSDNAKHNGAVTPEDMDVSSGGGAEDAQSGASSSSSASTASSQHSSISAVPEADSPLALSSVTQSSASSESRPAMLQASTSSPEPRSNAPTEIPTSSLHGSDGNHGAEYPPPTMRSKPECMDGLFDEDAAAPVSDNDEEITDDCVFIPPPMPPPLD